MQTVDEALKLLKRQAELEASMKQAGGIRNSAEQELHILQRKLKEFPEAIQAVVQAAHGLRRPVADISARDVESWATSGE
jgi:hypothetical protein